MAVLGPARTYLRINDAGCRLFGTEEKVIIGWSYEQLGHPLDLDVELDAHVRLAAGAGSVTYRRRFRSVRGDECVAVVRLCAGPAEQILQIIVPDPSQVPIGVAYLHGRLTQLGATLSHDALESVRQIGILSGLLAHRCAGLPPRELHTLATIEQAALKAGRQLRGLAALAALGLPVIDPAPVLLRPLIETAWNEQSVAAPDSVLTIEIADDLRWCCDPNQLALALRALLANAIGFRQPIRSLLVHCTVAIVDECCTIQVRDNGRGIPTFDQARLFRIFTTIGNDAGVGLGLAMVRAVAEGHGGQATLMSESGSGTVVSLTLGR